MSTSAPPRPRPRPPLFKTATCKGSYLLDTACGDCERCAWERAHMRGEDPQPIELTPRSKTIACGKCGKDLEVSHNVCMAFCGDCSATLGKKR